MPSLDKNVLKLSFAFFVSLVQLFSHHSKKGRIFVTWGIEDELFSRASSL